LSISVNPFADHAVDNVAMAVHQNGRQRGAFAMLGQKKRCLPAGRFDQAGGEVQLGEGGRQLLFQIGAQDTGPLGIQAFRLEADPAVELPEECAG
jgi:hypothetical protein